MTAFDTIVWAVRVSEYYVPRDYATIGGMWTVDTWKRGDITVQMMDEGYTTRIIAPGLRVMRMATNELVFSEGDEAILATIVEGLKGEE